jgi:hypothetical protein
MMREKKVRRCLGRDVEGGRGYNGAVVGGEIMRVK